MTKSLLFLLLAFSVCPAQTCKDFEDCECYKIRHINHLAYKVDSLIKEGNIKDSLNEDLKKIVNDNLTIEALQNSQKFYNDAFNSLLFKVSIILCVMGILVAIFGIFSGIVKSNKEKDFEKLNKDFLSMKEEIDKQWKEFKISKSETIKELAKGYLNIASNCLQSNESSFFSALIDFCVVYQRNKIDLNELDLVNFNRFDDLIKIYEAKTEIPKDVFSMIKIFLYSFRLLDVTYDNVDKIKEIWKSIFSKFGGEENVKQMVNDYIKELGLLWNEKHSKA